MIDLHHLIDTVSDASNRHNRYQHTRARAPSQHVALGVDRHHKNNVYNRRRVVLSSSNFPHSVTSLVKFWIPCSREEINQTAVRSDMFHTRAFLRRRTSQQQHGSLNSDVLQKYDSLVYKVCAESKRSSCELKKKTTLCSCHVRSCTKNKQL